MTHVCAAECVEGMPLTIMAYVTRDDRVTPLKSSDVSSAAISVFDAATGTVVTGFDALALTVESVFFDEVQSDGRWRNEEAAGYNFRYTIAGSAFPNSGRDYDIEVHWTNNDGTTGAAFYQARCRASRVK